MNEEDLRKAPKILTENIKIAFTPEYFIFGLSSGAQTSIYALTPAHAKRLELYLAHMRREYERVHGEIKADWQPEIKSPLRRIMPPREGS